MHSQHEIEIAMCSVHAIVLPSVSLEILTMATATGASASNGSGKAKRKSYAREFKLTVVNHYHDNNLYQTSNR